MPLVAVNSGFVSFSSVRNLKVLHIFRMSQKNDAGSGKPREVIVISSDDDDSAHSVVVVSSDEDSSGPCKYVATTMGSLYSSYKKPLRGPKEILRLLQRQRLLRRPDPAPATQQPAPTQSWRSMSDDEWHAMGLRHQTRQRHREQIRDIRNHFPKIQRDNSSA